MDNDTKQPFAKQFIPHDLFSDQGEDGSDVETIRFLHQCGCDLVSYTSPDNMSNTPGPPQRPVSGPKGCSSASAAAVSRALDWHRLGNGQRLHMPMRPASTIESVTHEARAPGTDSYTDLAWASRHRTQHNSIVWETFSQELNPTFAMELVKEALCRWRQEDYFSALSPHSEGLVTQVSHKLEYYRQIAWAKEMLAIYPMECAWFVSRHQDHAVCYGRRNGY